MAAPVRLALVWHMHQPCYRDALTGRTLLPWTRLHATKDYGDMVTVLRRHPRVHATFNLTPVLLDQLEAIASGDSDLYLDLARKPADRLTAEEQRFLARHFFSVNESRMLEPYPRYRELKARCGVAAGGARGSRDRPLTGQELRDLQTWFHLAWVDPEYRSEEPIRSLFAKGRDFTEEEKKSLLDWGVALAARVIEVYGDAARSGQIEISTSAYHHPILPLLVTTDAPREVSATIRLPQPVFSAPEDASAQVRRAHAAHARRFGAPPTGTWPPEGAVSQEALTILRGEEFEWCASDETVLARALGRPGPGGQGWAAALYRPYLVETGKGALSILFRDRALSDRIGFLYSSWDPERAAEDFLARVRDAGAGRGELLGSLRGRRTTVSRGALSRSGRGERRRGRHGGGGAGARPARRRPEARPRGILDRLGPLDLGRTPGEEPRVDGAAPPARALPVGGAERCSARGARGASVRRDPHRRGERLVLVVRRRSSERAQG